MTGVQTCALPIYLGGSYDDYPVDIQKTMDRETGGLVKIKVKNPEEIDKAREERGLSKPSDNKNNTPSERTSDKTSK